MSDSSMVSADLFRKKEDEQHKLSKAERDQAFSSQTQLTGVLDQQEDSVQATDMIGVERLKPEKLAWSRETAPGFGEKKAEKNDSKALLSEREERYKKAIAIADTTTVSKDKSDTDQPADDAAQTTSTTSVQVNEEFKLPVLETDEDVVKNFEKIRNAFEALKPADKDTHKGKLISNTYAYAKLRMDIIRHPAYGALLPHEMELIRLGKLKSKKIGDKEVDFTKLKEMLEVSHKLRDDYKIILLREEAVSFALHKDAELKAASTVKVQRPYGVVSTDQVGNQTLGILNTTERSIPNDDIRLREKDRIVLMASDDLLRGNLPKEVADVLRSLIEYANIRTTVSHAQFYDGKYWDMVDRKQEEAKKKGESEKIAFVKAQLTDEAKDLRKREAEKRAAMKKEAANLLAAKKKLMELSAKEKNADMKALLDSYIEHIETMTNGTLDIPKGATVVDCTKKKVVYTRVEKTEEKDKDGKVISTTITGFKKHSPKMIDKKKEPLFVHEPCSQDIVQGYLGDCYFMAGLASILATTPEAIKDMMKDDGKGNVTVRFYATDTTGNLQAKYYKVSKEVYPDGAFDTLWVQILEKAYAAFCAENPASKMKNNDVEAAKDHGLDPKEIDLTYIANGGYSDDVFRAVTGKSDGKLLYSRVRDKTRYLSDLFQTPEKAFEATKFVYKKDDKAARRKSTVDALTYREDDEKQGVGMYSYKEMEKYACEWMTHMLDETYLNFEKPKSYTGEYRSLSFEDRRLFYKNKYIALKKFLEDHDKGLTNEHDFEELLKTTRSIRSIDKSWVEAHKGDLLRVVRSVLDTILANYDDAIFSVNTEVFSGEYGGYELNVYDVIRSSLKQKIPVAVGAANIESVVKRDETNESKKSGLVGRHAYTVLGVEKVKMGGKTLRMVKLRNPWAFYNPDYVIDKGKTKPDFREGQTRTNGVFTIELNDFLERYDQIYIGGQPQLVRR